MQLRQNLPWGDQGLIPAFLARVFRVGYVQDRG